VTKKAALYLATTQFYIAGCRLGLKHKNQAKNLKQRGKPAKFNFI
jgi:hypothetical protein